jgi:hypothetical protein
MGIERWSRLETQAMRVLCRIVGLCLLLLAGAAAAQARDLRDTSSAEVAALQQRLTDARCYTGAIDGMPSEATEAAKKSCPDQEPILRIETGMHVAPIKRIGVDAQCKIAATGSDDKTVRLWSMPEGQLIRAQRFPIGKGNLGKIYAVAVSPDGRLVAAAGFDAHSALDGQMGVYIFDSAIGTSMRRIGAFGDGINHLAFSDDGTELAAALGAGQGIRVLDVASGRELMADTDFAPHTHSYGVAFGPDGALYATGFDGFLRRYGPNLQRTAKVAAPGGKQPFGIAVDPSGRKLAVSYDRSVSIDILDAGNLHRIANADTHGVRGDDLGSVAWTKDGTRLVAGGTPDLPPGGGRTGLRSWFPDGQKAGPDVPVSRDSIHSLAPCGSTIAFATADPSFGLLRADGTAVTLQKGRTFDARGKVGAAFTISGDATKVRFGLGEDDEMPVLFDLNAGILRDAPASVGGLIEPRVKGLAVTYWHNNLEPLLNGRPIQRVAGVGSRALAIQPDKSGFVLGTDWGLYAFTPDGSVFWEKPGPSVAWGVNLSADGRIVVAAYSDGTIRWHRWSNGKELLALFVDRLDRRWVAWTPSGYYAASPGGEDLIGWHVNRGWDQAADFFPASRFRERYSRPDIVRLVLATLDEEAAVKQANEFAKRREDTRPLIGHLPPVIRIADPADGTHVKTDTVTVDYALRSPSGQPVERIDVLINGRPVKAIGLPIRPVDGNIETTASVNVTLVQHITEVGLIAWSGGLASEAARIRLTWDGAPEATRRLYALVVGVSNYADPEMALTYAAKDARDFAKALQDQSGGYYVDVETRVLTDRDVTRSTIIDGLKWLEAMAKNPEDVSALFLAGHGLTDDKQTYWFLPSDATADDVRAKGVSQDELRRSLQSLSGKVLWFLDTCHAGSAAKRPPVDINVLVNTVSSAENGGIVVFASSTGRQVSAERDDWGNGAFTKAIVEGIALGKADLLGKGLITTSSLDTFVENRVQELTEGKQNPVMERPPEEPDFAIAEVRKR